MDDAWYELKDFIWTLRGTRRLDNDLDPLRQVQNKMDELEYPSEV